ncbi:MAG TPA: hypothetical protein VFG85_02925 [Gaiellaceae bacterium]|nr:hypothetical protein [Gaiellaceae bacterium]
MSTQATPGRVEGSSFRPLRMAETGQPAPFRLGAPAYLVAFAGWVVASLLLMDSASDLTGLAISGTGPVGAAHALGLVFFPFAVAAAVWQLLPVMLRNDPPRPRRRWVVLALLAGGVPLAVGLARGEDMLAALGAVVLAAGLVLMLSELATMIRRAPSGRLLVVSRPAVALAGLHAAAAFALGAVVLRDGGPEPLGIPYERMLLVHLSLAVIGWLTVLITSVGRTLVPMLGLAPAAPRRRVPVAEIVLVAGLWLYLVGVAWSVDALVAVGVVVMLGGLSPSVRLFGRVAASGKIGVREGPVAHVAVGLVFLLQAALLALAAVVGVASDRRAAVAGVLFLGLGWAVGVVVGHAGKLVSLSGWGSWPPGPRPKQADLYPRGGWQVEAVLFAVGVELLAGGVALDSEIAARLGAVALVLAALVALGSAAETVRRVVVSRP